MPATGRCPVVSPCVARKQTWHWWPAGGLGLVRNEPHIMRYSVISAPVTPRTQQGQAVSHTGGGEILHREFFARENFAPGLFRTVA